MYEYNTTIYNTNINIGEYRGSDSMPENNKKKKKPKPPEPDESIISFVEAGYAEKEGNDWMSENNAQKPKPWIVWIRFKKRG